MAKKKSGGSIGGFVFSTVNIGITIVMFITPTVALVYWYTYLRDPAGAVANPSVVVAPTAQVASSEPKNSPPTHEKRDEPAMSVGFFENSERQPTSSINPLADVQPVEQKPARDAYETRTWSDASGKFTIEAAFHSVTGDQVKLVSVDDRRLDVPIEKLCDADKDYLREIFRDKGIQPAF